jgi:3',5'-cyclic AMP phosphodiesterase CpdA
LAFTSFTIAHITDPHLSPAPFPAAGHFRLKRFMGWVNWKRGRQGRNDMAMLDRLVADLKAQKADHIAVTGDLVNIGMAVEFRAAAEWMKTFGKPTEVSFVPGNHDAYVRSSMALLGSTFAPWTTSDGGETVFPYLRIRKGVAIIGLSSAVPTGPLMATGKLGRAQLDAFAMLLDWTAARDLARVVLIHHPPLSKGAPPLRGLTDAAAFERVIAKHGAEAVLHGHSHKQLVGALPSRKARTVGGAVPVLGAPSASAAVHDPRQRAAYHLVRVEREGELWKVSARVRGLALDSEAIGEREALAI